MNYKLKIWLVIGLGITTALVGCGKKTKRVVEKPAVPEKSIMETIQPMSKRTTTVYEYGAANLRNPFAPLTGGGKVASFKTTEEAAPTIDINSLTLKGVIYDEKTRNALLVAPSGESYIVKGGRLLASASGKYVEGVAGIVKKESVVLITKGNVIREVKLREEEY